MFSALRARVSGWLANHVSQPQYVRGFRVVVDNSRADIQTSAVLERLNEALALLERYEPRRVRHLQQDLAQILVARYPCRGAYMAESRTCLTELTFLARRDISAAVVASSILHEGTHARVAQFRTHVGGAAREEDRAREERLCRRAEIAFGEALPPGLGAAVVQRARDSLAMDDVGVAPVIDWTVARERINEADKLGQSPTFLRPGDER